MTDQKNHVTEKEDFTIFKNKQEAFSSYLRAKKKFKKPTFNCTVKYSSTNFSYADLSEVLNSAEAHLLEEGLFIMHTMTYEGDSEWLTTYLQHKNGEKIGFCKMPIDIKGKKMQEIGSQITYLRRYSLLSILSLTGESDDDGKEVEGQTLNNTITTAEQKQKITVLKELFDSISQEEKPLILKYFKVVSLDKLSVSKLDPAIVFLRKKIQMANGG